MVPDLRRLRCQQFPDIILLRRILCSSLLSVAPPAPQDVAKQLRDQQMVMKGHRDDALVHVSGVEWFWSEREG